jgi:hypothetical protein
VVSLHSTFDIERSMLEAILPYLSFLCVNNPFSPSFDLERSMLDVGIEKSFSVVCLLGDLCVLAVKGRNGAVFAEGCAEPREGKNFQG